MRPSLNLEVGGSGRGSEVGYALAGVKRSASDAAGGAAAAVVPAEQPPGGTPEKPSKKSRKAA